MKKKGKMKGKEDNYNIRKTTSKKTNKNERRYKKRVVYGTVKRKGKKR